MVAGGHAWQWACMAWGTCMCRRWHAWQGHAWQGGMHDSIVGACMAWGVHGRGHAWQGVCMAGGHAWQGVCMALGHAWHGG